MLKLWLIVNDGALKQMRIGMRSDFKIAGDGYVIFARIKELDGKYNFYLQGFIT
jgi:hypothetical protein